MSRASPQDGGYSLPYRQYELLGEPESTMATVRDPARVSGYEHFIQTLAEENSTTVDHVRELFESTHARLESEARIQTYVSVIATRLVRHALQAERAATSS